MPEFQKGDRVEVFTGTNWTPAQVLDQLAEGGYMVAFTLPAPAEKVRLPVAKSDVPLPPESPPESASWWLTPVWPFHELTPLHLVGFSLNALFWGAAGWMLKKLLAS